MRSWCAAAWAGTALVVLLVLTGCGDGMSDVSGVVKVDGKEIENGSIKFVPADGKSQPTNCPIKAGHYATRVPVGNMKVAISALQPNGKKKLYANDPKSPERDLFKESLPARYSDDARTELRLDVAGGSVQKDWELSSK